MINNEAKARFVGLCVALEALENQHGMKLLLEALISNHEGKKGYEKILVDGLRRTLSLYERRYL